MHPESGVRAFLADACRGRLGEIRPSPCGDDTRKSHAHARISTVLFSSHWEISCILRCRLLSSSVG
jgi:hypothetical protein